MSTLNEPHVYEQVLYRGKGKNKWEQRYVSVKSEINGKSVVKVLPTQRKRISWRRKKPETFELSPNSHAIIHMSSLGDQRNVIGILPLRRGPQPRGHFFTSESREVLDNLKAILTNCCDVASFEVDFETDPKSSASTKAQLLIFRDRVCLSTNLGYEFKLLREWPIDSLSWLPTAHVGVTLIPFSEAQEEETLLLRTERGNDICAKLIERHCYLAPTGHQQIQYNSNLAAGVQRCDGNSNIMSTSRLSKSCESVHQLHFQPLGSKSKTFPLTKAKPSLGSRQLSSLSRLPSYLQAKSPLSSDESISKKEIDHHFSVSSSPASTGQCSNSDNDVNAQKQLELTVHKVCSVVNGTKDDDKLSTEENQDQGEPLPPPIPQRQPQHNSAKAESTKQAMEKSNDNAKYSERNYSVEDLTIQRTRSFQIVEQPLSGHGRRQRYKSDSSLVTKTAFTELVRPICLDLPSAKSDNHGLYLYLQKSGATNTEPCEGVCSQKQEEENACSCAVSENGVEPFESEPTAIQSRASTSVFVDEKSQVKDDTDSSDSTCHYVNLPEGSRPSCYLYMNLPDLRKAPKEATSYVNHVFMSRSMKGIYENVQQFYNEKFETAVSSEEGTSAPPLPPPALHPRQPPPRIPKRASKDQQGVQKSLDRPPIHIRVPLGPPPPRPPKKHLSVTKEGVLNPQQDDIQVQIAVFASKAVAGRVWFLRIVVMKHDPDDTTFKTVKDREIASKYHLMQTYPFSISSDIVVSLKHQCQQFKLSSEDYQEVEYNIIGNLVHGFWFVIEFHLEHMGSDTDQFVGNVCVEPKNLPAGEKCPVNKRVNLGITEDFNLKQNSGCDQHGNPYMQGSQACKPVIPDYVKQKEICSKLDITMYSGNNWRDVAGKLGFDTQEINIIDDKARRCPNFSPMENVLTTWEQRDPGCSLDRLVNILRDIQRLDVVSDLGFPVDLESS